MTQYPVSPAEMNFWQQQSKNAQTQISKIISLLQFCLNFLIIVKYFMDDCLQKKAFAHNSFQSPSNFNILTFCLTLKPFSSALCKSKISYGKDSNSKVANTILQTPFCMFASRVANAILHVCFRSKIDIRNLSPLVGEVSSKN